MERLTKTAYNDTKCSPYVISGIEYCGDSYEGKVIDRLAAYEDIGLEPEKCAEIIMMREIHTVDAKVITHGKWLVKKDGTVYCSHCNCNINDNYDTAIEEIPYCQYCGSQMDLHSQPTETTKEICGYWIESEGFSNDTCSICGKQVDIMGCEYNYCPHCGYPMNLKEVVE